jgi:hypothetical protein
VGSMFTAVLALISLFPAHFHRNPSSSQEDGRINLE